jgi:hypothetical protein
MEKRSVHHVQFAAAQVAGIAGMLHLGIGIRYWSAYLVGGTLVPPDIRVPLWTVSGVAILAGIVAGVYRPRWRRALYVGGVAILLGYVAAYFSWHLTGHVSLVFLGDPQLHGVGLGRFLLDHALAGPLETVALLAELLGASLLTVLIVVDDGPE